MKRNKLYLLVMSFILPLIVFAGRVRTLYVNDKKMEKIFLSPGKSTILHFLEKPEKFIVGNLNYINIEFTGNDITLVLLCGVFGNNQFVIFKE